MFSYKDMTFCNSDCTNTECERKLTPEVVNNASHWWGGDDAPIAISNFSNSCESYVGVNNEQINEN